MFGKAIQTGVGMGIFKQSGKQKSQTATQSKPQKKKKKTTQTSGAMQMKRGGKGRRSLIST